jgi:hypothetical protein
MITVFVAVVFAILFFRVADYERMSPWVWSIASIAITEAVTLSGGSLTLVLLLQAALFGVMWGLNARRLERRRRERQAPAARP